MEALRKAHETDGQHYIEPLGGFSRNPIRSALTNGNGLAEGDLAYRLPVGIDDLDTVVGN
jgi:hypothetical protein